MAYFVELCYNKDKERGILYEDCSYRSFYAAKLSKTNDVIAFEHFENKINLINKEGINLIEDNFTTNYHVRCFKDGEVSQAQDLVLVCVKATQTQEAIKANIGFFISSENLTLTLMVKYVPL